MADIKYKPVSHDHEAFLKKASKRKGFRKAYGDLEEEYRLTREMLAARSKFGLTQEVCAGSRLSLGDQARSQHSLSQALNTGRQKAGGRLVSHYHWRRTAHEQGMA